MRQDMTKGSPIKLILAFTMPLLLGNLFQQLYSMADTFIVGRILGVNALAAVGCTGSLVFFTIGCAQGITAGFSIVTTQKVGAKDDAGVRKSFAVSIYLSIIVAIVLTVLGGLLSKQLLQLMQTPTTIIDGANDYFLIIMLGSSAMMLFNLLSNVLRAFGDSKSPLYFLIVACIINIILDYVFIGPLKMGVMGAAIATVLAQLVSGLLCVLVIVKKYPLLRLSKEDFKISRKDVYEHLRMGLPMGFQNSIIAIGAISVQFALNNLGEIAVAAFTTAQKVDSIATMPLASFGLAMATFTGQNYGAGRYDRVRTGVKQCIILSGSTSIVAGLLMILFGEIFAKIFLGAGQEAVSSLAGIALSINGFFYWSLCLLFIFRNTLQGLGKSIAPTVAGIMELIMRCAASIGLAQVFGFVGACWAGPLAWMGSLVVLGVALFAFMRQVPKNNVVKTL